MSKANTGIIVPGIVGIIIIVVSLLKINGILIIKKRKIRLIAWLIFLTWLISFVVIEALIIYGVEDEFKETDYVILLGGGVKDGQPSPTLYKRLVKGIDYLEQNDSKVIVSGGLDYGEKYSEAEVMKRFLISKGIEEDRIIKEEKATSTMENFIYSEKLLGDSNEITVITNDFHMYRSKMLAKRNGLVSYGLSTETPLSVKINCYIREYFAFVKSYIFDR